MIIRPYGDDEDENPNRSGDQKQESGELNAPHVDNQGKVTNKAVSSAGQAHSICKSLKKTSMEEGGRLSIQGQVREIYDGATPYKQKALDAAGQGWRANFCSGFLSSIIDRVTPQLRDPIYRVETLTHANLPPEVAGAAEKSRTFREITTKTIRGWNGWNDFVSMLSQDVVIYGCAAPGRVNRDWRPRRFGPDETYLFEKSFQHASKIQLICFWESVMVHDFMEILRDKDAAQIAKYDIEGCIKAVNHASTKGNTSDRTQIEDVDTMREKGTLQESAENQGRVIKLFHLIVQEYDGKLALWTTSEEGGHLVRHIEDCEEVLDFEALPDAVTLFTLQVGNGRFYGSKGIARMIANISLAAERGRCLALDQHYLAGLPIIKTESGDAAGLTVVVQHPFVIIKGKGDVLKEFIKFNATDWKTLDDNLMQIAESIAGSFIPPNLDTGGASNTKIEAAQKAEREMAVRQGVLGRFFAQFADLVGMIKRGIYSAENLKEGWRVFQENEAKRKKGIRVWAKKVYKLIQKVLGKTPEMGEQRAESKIADYDAVCAVVELLENGLTMEEIIQLREAPDGNDIQGSNAERDQETMDWIAANAQNPFMNKKEATMLSARIKLGEDRAKSVVNTGEQDPNDQALNSRQQVIEWSEMMSGEPMEVAATDLHAVHREVLVPRMDGLINAINHSLKTNVPLPPELILGAQIVVDHFGQHIALDTETPDEEKAQHAQMHQTWLGIIKAGVKLVDKQQKEREAENAAMQQANGAPTDPKVLLEGKKLELEERKIDIQDRQQQHNERMDGLKFAKEVATEKADAALKGADAANAEIESEKARKEAKEQAERETQIAQTNA